VTEWTENLLAVETKEFQTRDRPPDKDSAGMYLTSGPVILFQMVNQQVDLAATSGREQLCVDVVIECCDIMTSSQEGQADVLRSEEVRRPLARRGRLTRAARGAPGGVPAAQARRAGRHRRVSDGLDQQPGARAPRSWRPQPRRSPRRRRASSRCS
jgi:hypothetical protein